MEFEWDEDKRRRNVERHGYDFLDGVLVFAGEYYCRYSPRQGEERWLAIRSVGGLEMAVVFTLRGEREEITRIISVRRAKRRERRQYHAHLRARGLAQD
ncbi:MAG: BrnT family toxin [Geminicoccaceae bacterium]